MSRRTPDPRFAAAARAELLRRAAGSQEAPPASSARRRRAVVELMVSVAVVLVAAAVLVGVGRTPTRDTRHLAARPATASAPATVSPTGSPTPTTGTTPGPGLVGPTGSRIRSDADIRAFAAAQGFSTVWAEQAVLDTACMASQGFVYDPILNATDRAAVGDRGMTEAEETAYAEAEDGPVTSGPYDWRTAGCHGRSVHVTGQDHAN